MKIVFLLCVIISSTLLFAIYNKNSIEISEYSKSIYDYSAISIDSQNILIEKYKGKKIIIVNVASKCGYTYQYEGLQELHEKHNDKVVVLGFPSNDFLFQEPGSNETIKEFCTKNYGVDFQMFQKINVKKSKKQHPVYTWLSNKNLNGWNDKMPSWNFCKYLIDEEGQLVQFYSSSVKPLSKEILDFINN